MKIVIPTLGRMDNQITYNNLPQKWKNQTIFVVQQQEGDAMQERYPNNEVIVLFVELLTTVEDPLCLHEKVVISSNKYLSFGHPDNKNSLLLSSGPRGI